MKKILLPIVVMLVALSPLASKPDRQPTLIKTKLWLTKNLHSRIVVEATIGSYEGFCITCFHC